MEVKGHGSDFLGLHKPDPSSTPLHHCLCLQKGGFVECVKGSSVGISPKAATSAKSAPIPSPPLRAPPPTPLRLTPREPHRRGLHYFPFPIHYSTLQASSSQASHSSPLPNFQAPNFQTSKLPNLAYMQKKGASLSTGSLKVPAACYSPTGEPRSTLADEALHFRVRDGNGCCILSMATGKTKNVSGWNAKQTEASLHIEVITASLWAISIGQLSALLRVHFRPIKVVVFHLPSPLTWGRSCLRGGLALRCFQRLSVPHIATRRVPLA